MKILFIDMDNVLVDFQSAFQYIDKPTLEKNIDNLDDIDGIFSLMKPMPGALEAYHFLSKHFDTYILSTAPWNNPSAWIDKLLWVKKHLPEVAYKRLIITHHKNLCQGDYLIDDRRKNGVDKFKGEHIHFGTQRFPDWKAVLEYLCEIEGIKHHK